MRQSIKRVVLDTDAGKVDPSLTEIDRVIATVQARIVHQRVYVLSLASDFEASMKAIAELNTMTSTLEKLECQRAQMVHWDQVGSHQNEPMKKRSHGT